MQTTKLGTAIPVVEISIIMLSIHFPRLSAAMGPERDTQHDGDKYGHAADPRGNFKAR